jgi:hypothetical protein
MVLRDLNRPPQGIGNALWPAFVSLVVTNEEAFHEITRVEIVLGPMTERDDPY